MDIIEIVLLAAGGIIFILGFLIPDKKGLVSVESQRKAGEEIKTLVEKELDNVRGRINDITDEAVTYALEKTERSLERISNEKIMAVNEYSDTVLEEIHKNHEEAMFLYDMLNNKHESLKNTVSEVTRTVKEAEETMTRMQEFSQETAMPEEPVPEQEDIPEKMAEADPEAEKSENVNSNDRILELYRRGKSRVEIAKALELGVGEVSLVIDLFTNQQKQDEKRMLD